jgi:DNA repair ATPase RecN
MASVIPFGQPILIGHHSEKRDRNYRARITSNMNKSCELQKKADYYESKAAGVGTGGISSDDPDAVTKLQKKLANLEKSQETMKACNKIIKKYSDEEKRIAELMKVGITEAQAREVLKPDCFGGIGFAPYSLQNNNAEIRRIRGRIEDLTKIKKNVAFTKEEYENFSYQIDDEENRVMFIFSGKPDEETRTILKRNAFKYSPTRNAWVRKITNNALYDARTVKEKLLTM